MGPSGKTIVLSAILALAVCVWSYYIGLAIQKSNERNDPLTYHNWQDDLDAFPQYLPWDTKSAQILCEYRDRCDGGWGDVCKQAKRVGIVVRQVRHFDPVMAGLTFYHSGAGASSQDLYDIMTLLERLRASNVTKTYGNMVKYCRNKSYYYVARLINEHLRYDIEKAQREKHERVAAMDSIEL